MLDNSIVLFLADCRPLGHCLLFELSPVDCVDVGDLLDSEQRVDLHLFSFSRLEFVVCDQEVRWFEIWSFRGPLRQRLHFISSLRSLWNKWFVFQSFKICWINSCHGRSDNRYTWLFNLLFPCSSSCKSFGRDYIHCGATFRLSLRRGSAVSQKINRSISFVLRCHTRISRRLFGLWLFRSLRAAAATATTAARLRLLVVNRRVELDHIPIEQVFEEEWSRDLIHCSVHNVSRLFRLVAKHVVKAWGHRFFNSIKSVLKVLNTVLSLLLKLYVVLEVDLYVFEFRNLLF